MPFKIVNTIEKGRSVLTTVPSNWEKDGTLFWPRFPSIKVNKLRRVEHSVPEEGWAVINCILKRTKLNTFENAELEIEKMCSNSDTETDNERENKNLKTKPPFSFEQMIQECIDSPDMHSFRSVESSSDTSPVTAQNQLKTHQKASVFKEPQVITISQAPQVASVVEGTQEFCIEDLRINNELIIADTLATKIDNLISKVNTIQENQTILQANINTILENQKLCYEGQQLMMLNLSHTVTQFEEYINKSSQSSTNTENVDFQIIRDVEELRHLERSLENSEKELVIKKQLSTICGKGKGRGINNAYALIDVMFDRIFLKSCSWAGGSRTTETKVCFKSFTKVIKLFFDIVHNSDNCFTLRECHDFFKNVLKNSTQRCQSKKLRTSTTKHRPRKKDNNIYTEKFVAKDKINEKIRSDPDQASEDQSDVEKSNKVSSTVERKPQSNPKIPLKEIQNFELISVDAEVYV